MSNFYECHCHIALESNDFRKAAKLHENGVCEKLIRENLAAYRNAGIGYVRDGGDKWGASAFAKKVATEYEIEYVSPVFPIYKKGNYGGFIGVSYDTMEDFSKLVLRAKNEGADFIKLMGSGIMEFDCYGALTGFSLEYDELKKIADIVHKNGLSLMVHMNSARGIIDAVKAGVDSIEHGNYMNDDAVDVLADSECVLVPTVSATVNLIGTGLFPDEMLNRILAMQMKGIEKAGKKGVKLAAGSDAGAKCVAHAEGLMQEVKLLLQVVDADVLTAGQEKIRKKFIPYRG